MKYDRNLFIEKSNLIHGNIYDYRLVEYTLHHKKVMIICDNHGIFEQTPSNHLRGQGCKKCFYIRMTSNSKSFIEKSNLIHKNRYDYSLVEYLNSYTKIKIICHTHGIFEQKPSSHLNGQSCKKCIIDIQSLGLDDFIVKSNLSHNNRYDYSLSEYSGYNKNIKIICPDHGIFEQKVSNHLIGSGCHKCSVDKVRNKKYIEMCKNKFNNKYDYSLVEYLNNKQKVDIICPEHGVFSQTMKNHFKFDGCPYCSGKRMNTKLFIKKSNIKHNNFFDYSISEYKSAFEHIKIICPNHGEFSQVSSSHLHGAGCPICKASKGEKEIISILNDICIDYIHQKKFDGCKNVLSLVFDFFIPSMNLCIEYNGTQHYILSEYFGGIEGFKLTKKKDKIKKEYCKANNIDLLVITFKNNIKNKLVKYINENRG